MKSSVSIIAAITGAITSKNQNIALPTQPREIVMGAFECYNAGAAVVHVHVGNRKDEPSLDYNMYKEIITDIRKRSDMMICISTSSYGISIEDEERLKVLDLKPDFASLTFGTVIRKNGLNVNSMYYIEKALDKMMNLGIVPEIEVFNEKMLDNCLEHCEKKKINPYIQLIFGAEGGMTADMNTVNQMVNCMPEWCIWSAAGIGKQQLPVNIFALLRGASFIRTGFEDNVYMKKNVLACSNVELVLRLKGIVEQLQVKVATANETREILDEVLYGSAKNKVNLG